MGRVASGEFEAFNLKSMSGVFPGSRTARFAHVRLSPIDAAQNGMIWARLLWEDEPRACAVYLHEDEPPLLSLPVPDMASLCADLRAELAAAGYSLRVCGSCQHWRPATRSDAETLPVGRCAWLRENTAATPHPDVLTAQSVLAVDCPHWVEATAAQPPGELDDAPAVLPRAAVDKQETQRARRSPWGRLKARFTGKGVADDAHSAAHEFRWLEQSGVGAGTEPCLACHGRIANLGSRSGKTTEGDQETYSVWRCRACHTLYLNQWIDRWVRLDTLETVERYWRVSPAEAVALLASIEQKDQDDGSMVETICATRRPLSEQTKQGR